VTTADCVTPLRDVELDVWQANDDGHYDNDGTMPKDVGLLLRGRIRTDGDGRYRVKSILPGRYLNGAKYRPAHVHVKLRATSHAPLTTQLYFPDDPYNDGDPFIHRSLVMDVKKADGKMVARFDFALRQLTGRT
jgi:catechol 1,2-dioxygenase